MDVIHGWLLIEVWPDLMSDGEDVHLLDEAGLVGGDELGEGDQGRPQLLPRVRQPHPRPLLVGQQPSRDIQGDHSGQLQPPVDLVPTVLAASGPLLHLHTAQAS